MHQTHCYNESNDYIIGGCFPSEEYETAFRINDKINGFIFLNERVFL